jgi:hypothetical protein
MNVEMCKLRFLSVAFLSAAVIAASGVDARANCVVPTARAKALEGVQKSLAGSATARLARPGIAPPLADAAQGNNSSGGGSIVGLWQIVLTDSQLGVIDFGFQQFHQDGTEFMSSGGVPPTLGNLCVGVWERGAGGVIRLRHVGWNFDPALGLGLGVAPTGYFHLEVTLRTNSQGTAYSGTFRAASYDLGAGPLGSGGNPQPGTEFAGTVEAVRISVQ